MKNFPKVFFVQVLSFFPTVVLGQGLGQAPVPLNISPPANSGATVLNVINYTLGFIGAIIIAYLIYGIFRYFMAGNNEDQFVESRSTMTGALISIIAVGVFAALVNFVANAISGNLNVGGL